MRTARQQRERIQRVKIKKRKLKFLTCARGDVTRALNAAGIPKGREPHPNWRAEYVIEPAVFVRVTPALDNFIKVLAALNLHPRLSVCVNMTTPAPTLEILPKKI